LSSAGYVTLTVYSPASFGFVVVYSFFPFTEYSTTGVVLLLDVDFTSTTSYPSYVLSNSFWVVVITVFDSSVLLIVTVNVGHAVSDNS